MCKSSGSQRHPFSAGVVRCQPQVREVWDLTPGQIVLACDLQLQTGILQFLLATPSDTRNCGVGVWSG